MKRFYGIQVSPLLKIYPLLVAVTLLSAAIPAFAVTRIGTSTTPQVGGASCCTCNSPGGQIPTEETAFSETVATRGCGGM